MYFKYTEFHNRPSSCFSNTRLFCKQHEVSTGRTRPHHTFWAVHRGHNIKCLPSPHTPYCLTSRTIDIFHNPVFWRKMFKASLRIGILGSVANWSKSNLLLILVTFDSNWWHFITADLPMNLQARLYLCSSRSSWVMLQIVLKWKFFIKRPISHQLPLSCFLKCTHCITLMFKTYNKIIN